MSWVSDRLGIHLGNIGAPIGAAIGSVIPGVGTAIGAGLGGAIGGLGHGDSLGSSVAQGAAGAIGGGALSKIPGLQGVSDFLGGNGGKNALGALQGLNAAYNQQKASGMANNALGTVQAEWDRRAPLRAQGQAQMLNPGAGIAARIAAIPQGANPYAPPTPKVAPVASGKAFLQSRPV